MKYISSVNVHGNDILTKTNDVNTPMVPLKLRESLTASTKQNTNTTITIYVFNITFNQLCVLRPDKCIFIIA